jgi:hypothetical protein
MSGADYVVAIPSYNRADVISKKTLKMLAEGGVPASKIYIFMANEQERKAYEAAVPANLYHKLVVGVKGIQKQRVFISRYFPENQYVVSVDDDVEQIEKLQGTEKLVKIKDVDAFFKKAYADLKQHGLYLWGIYPVRNPFFMKPNMSTGLKFIIGVLRGFINRHSRDLDPKTAVKEDHEQSILFYRKDGGVIRYNNITTKTKFNAEGGLGKDREEGNRIAAEYMKRTYPELVTVFHRKNGMAEIKLKNVKQDDPQYTKKARTVSKRSRKTAKQTYK